MRPSWDSYFLEMAKLVSTRSTCLRRQVGAVIVKDRQVIATGYNGAPVGLGHCKVCMREELNVPSGQRYELCKSVHAEANAIIQCALHGASTRGATIYIATGYPCIMCAKMLINAQVGEVRCSLVRSQRVNLEGLEILEKAKIPVIGTYD